MCECVQSRFDYFVLLCKIQLTDESKVSILLIRH